MIRTRFGSKVKIVGGHVTSGLVRIQRVDDGKFFTCSTIELKADGGLKEIQEAITAAQS